MSPHHKVMSLGHIDLISLHPKGEVLSAANALNLLAFIKGLLCIGEQITVGTVLVLPQSSLWYCYNPLVMQSLRVVETLKLVCTMH